MVSSKGKKTNPFAALAFHQVGLLFIKKHLIGSEVSCFFPYRAISSLTRLDQPRGEEMFTSIISLVGLNVL